MPHRSGADRDQVDQRSVSDIDRRDLSGLAEEHYAVKMIRERAAAFLSGQGDPSEIATAVRAVSQGRRYLTARMAELLAAGLDASSADPLLRLSEREFQVFTKLARGINTEKTCHELKMTPKTVSSNCLRTFEKMGVKTDSELTYYSDKNGLIF